MVSMETMPGSASLAAWRNAVESSRASLTACVSVATARVSAAPGPGGAPGNMPIEVLTGQSTGRETGAGHPSGDEPAGADRAFFKMLADQAFTHNPPRVNGCSGSPRTSTARPSRTETSIAQVSGQSCGHAPRTVAVACSFTVAVMNSPHGRPSPALLRSIHRPYPCHNAEKRCDSLITKRLQNR